MTMFSFFYFEIALLSATFIPLVVAKDGIKPSGGGLRKPDKSVEGPMKIVGGVDAALGDFPYFVHTQGGGCGGALISDQWVLSAAHCGNMNGQVYIGPYESCFANGNCPNGEPAQCVEYFEYPGYNSVTSGGDFSLCKLSEPVTIDTSKVTLELNWESSVPADGSDVIAIGLGTLFSGGPLSSELQNVTVQAISNAVCDAAYSSESITDDMICAGVDGGGKDSCQGDSGGPLIQEVYNGDGTFTHKHIGVVSWGYGCALADFPGVYARTSAGEEFIKNTVCAPGETNLPDFCDGWDPLSLAPTQAPCVDPKLQLNVDIFPDYWPSEISYALLESNGGAGTYLINVNEGEVAAGFLDVESSSACLEPNKCYGFVINDSYGDGLTTGQTDYGNVGFYQLILDGYVVGAGKDYGSQDIVEFCLDSEGKVVDRLTCPSAAKDVTLTVRPDYYADETGYSGKFYNYLGGELTVVSVAVGDLGIPFYPYQHQGCLPRGTHTNPGCLEFTFTDTYGDGIFEGGYGDVMGIGGYNVVMDGDEVFASEPFDYTATNNFCADLGCSEEYGNQFLYMGSDYNCGYALFLAPQPLSCDDSLGDPGMSTVSDVCPLSCSGACPEMSATGI